MHTMHDIEIPEVRVVVVAVKKCDSAFFFKATSWSIPLPAIRLRIFDPAIPDRALVRPE